MAECRRFVCSGCGHTISSWSDGNPFYLDDSGNKVYAYHPNHEELEKCIANDSPHLCLQCGTESNLDSRLDPPVCPECESGEVVGTFRLEGVKCPKCNDGRFAIDKDFLCIS